MEIVSFEIAQKLKEKGFKEKCLAYYDIDDNVGLLYNTQYSDEYSPCQYTDLLQSHNTDTAVAQPDDSENCCDAPTISQVLKWLREEKLIHLGIDIGRSGWYVTSAINIKEYDDGWDFRLHHSMEGYSSYEEVALAGISWTLDNLI